MKIGIPNGLLYKKYHVFTETFFQELGAEIMISPDTNRAILDVGVNCCVDDACLPVKVYHGHVSWLKNRCDMILVPRMISIQKKKYVCPMFCGLIEMLRSSIPDLPRLIAEPVYSTGQKELQKWARIVGQRIHASHAQIKYAYQTAINRQKISKTNCEKKNTSITVAMIGHPYIIRDRFLSMDIIRKLHGMGVSVFTEDDVGDAVVMTQVKQLFKEPFWYFAARYYGAAMALRSKVDGVIYISAFSCGIDSVVTELIKDDVQDLPMLVLKIDEHTGEAGFNTRVEAYVDMLKRRAFIGCNDTSVRKHLPCCKSPV
jgi:predicted nucleotide-binding protein (sugar kinase/HSP70/actin superfamily)